MTGHVIVSKVLPLASPFATRMSSYACSCGGFAVTDTGDEARMLANTHLRDVRLAAELAELDAEGDVA